MAIRTIVALFDDYPEAEGAIRELESAGVPSADVPTLTWPPLYGGQSTGAPEW